MFLTIVTHTLLKMQIAAAATKVLIRTCVRLKMQIVSSRSALLKLDRMYDEPVCAVSHDLQLLQNVPISRLYPDQAVLGRCFTQICPPGAILTRNNKFHLNNILPSAFKRLWKS